MGGEIFRWNGEGEFRPGPDEKILPGFAGPKSVGDAFARNADAIAGPKSVGDAFARNGKPIEGRRRDVGPQMTRPFRDQTFRPSPPIDPARPVWAIVLPAFADGRWRTQASAWRDLGGRVGKDSVRATIIRLEERGLLERTNHPNGRRIAAGDWGGPVRFVWRLTDRGCETLRDLDEAIAWRDSRGKRAHAWRMQRVYRRMFD